jgi:phosphoribosylaminoimidazolecarboxamide formyltransferase / IMP cyclohydrolase
MAERPRTSRSPQNRERNAENRYALLSVFNKTGIVDFARTLDTLGYRIISTGGTAKALTEGGLQVVPIQEVTGNPESFDGRMKTISFQIEGGILFDRTNREHVMQARELGVPRIDIVVANLYPFEQTLTQPGVTEEEKIEMIDVGGPTMVRAAAKNHKNVLVVTDPADYERVSDQLRSGRVDKELRRELAAKAFGHLSFYDSQIARELRSGEIFPEEITIPGRRISSLRYGENPHQRGALYIEPGSSSPMANLERVAGGEPSLTNLTDIAAGLELVRMLGKDISAAVIKHNTPCGVASGETSAQALERAIESDPVSAFGGVIVLNGQVDMRVANVIARFKENRGQFDIIAATGITEKARELITSIRKRTGIYTFGEIIDQKRAAQIKTFDGGFILQEWDDDPERTFKDWQIVTEKKPTREQLRQMRFAWKIIGRIKSNTIIVVDKKIPMTRGIGSGQTSRVGSTEIALAQAGENAKGAVLASDSFFPFADSVRLAAEAGISAIVQQGGSVNDKLSIDAANEADIAMVMTGERKFWH